MRKVSKGLIPKNKPALDFSDLINQRSKMGGNRDRFSFNDSARIRIIPFEHDGKLQVFAMEQTHFNPSPDVKFCGCLGPDNECPLCSLFADGVKSCIPTIRYLCHIVDMDDPNRKVKLYQAPATVAGPIMDVVINIEEYPDTLDPKRGKPFILKKTGTLKNTRYTAQISGKPAPLDPAIFSGLSDLQAIVDRPKDANSIRELADSIRADITF